MTVTFCDITGKRIDNPTTNYTWGNRAGRYDTLLDKDLSVEGKAKLDETVNKSMASKKQFNFMDYKTSARSTLDRLVR